MTRSIFLYKLQSGLFQIVTTRWMRPEVMQWYRPSCVNKVASRPVFMSYWCQRANQGWNAGWGRALKPITHTLHRPVDNFVGHLINDMSEHQRVQDSPERADGSGVPPTGLLNSPSLPLALFSRSPLISPLLTPSLSPTQPFKLSQLRLY